MSLLEEAEQLAKPLRNKPRWALTEQEKLFLEAWEKHKDAPTAEYAAKLRQLEELKQRMHPRDRKQFEQAQEKHKANIDHDLWVASMHVPPRGARYSS